MMIAIKVSHLFKMSCDAQFESEIRYSKNIKKKTLKDQNRICATLLSINDLFKKRRLERPNCFEVVVRATSFYNLNQILQVDKTFEQY
jgi:hypothetical protein